MTSTRERETLLNEYKVNRYAAHQYLFAHRRKDESPPFHREIVNLFNAPAEFVAMEAFRGGAKTTFLEEDILLKALFREINFGLVVGNNWSSACLRLAAIRSELETNDALIELFGDQKSSPWAADELQLANGVKLIALGARQSMRGVKHNSERPDYAAIDDLEDEDNIGTEEARRKTERWLVSTLIPALDPNRRKVRFIGTAIHPKALIHKKCEDPEWQAKKFPIFYIDPETGRDTATWPGRFSMEWVYKTRSNYLKDGNLIEFNQEYMCQAEDMAGKPFQASMIKIAPVPAHYLPTDLIVDPARTTNEKSARTGYVVGSWSGSKLIVQHAQGHFHKPSEIVNTIFDLYNKFKPVNVLVESNSLEEFIMEPLRDKMLDTGVSLPLYEDNRAPKDKISFIKGLQPFYSAGSVTHTENFPDLEAELQQFPTGRIDVPNALAYMLRLKSGRSVYEDFSLEHIAPALEVNRFHPRWLVMSSRPAMCCAILLQYINGSLRIYHDWIVNKPPQEALADIIREATMLGEGQIKMAAPIEQFDIYTNTGLPAAARRSNATVIRAAAAAKSEGVLKDWLVRRARGETVFLVDQEAFQTINGLARGYRRKLGKDGTLEDLPVDNQYRVLVEALESFVAWFDRQNKTGDNDSNVRYATTGDGRRYLTSLPGRL